MEDETPNFVAAARLGNRKYIEAYLKNGGDPNVLCDGTSALHIATEKEDMGLILYLMSETYMNVNIRDFDGETALMYACGRRTDVRCVLALLRYGANPNLRNKFGKTALHIAVLNKNIKNVLCLLKYDADTNVIDTFGNTPLSLACIETTYFAMVKLLINKGADLDIPLSNTMPLFLEICLCCHDDIGLDIIYYLIKRNVNYNIVDPLTKKTALHIVTATGNASLGTKFLKKRMDVQKKDVAGRTPIKLAKIMNLKNMIALFEDYLFYLEVLQAMKKDTYVPNKAAARTSAIYFQKDGLR